MDPTDLQAELKLWRSTELSHETRTMALLDLQNKVKNALSQQKELVDALKKELTYSLCWPEEIGSSTLVSKVYMLLGPADFPIPDDPEPIRLSLEVNEEKLSSLKTVLKDIQTLLSLLEDR